MKTLITMIAPLALMLLTSISTQAQQSAQAQQPAQDQPPAQATQPAQDQQPAQATPSAQTTVTQTAQATQPAQVTITPPAPALPPAPATQPSTYGLGSHFYGGYTRQTGDFSPGGFEGGIDWRLSRYLALVGEASFVFTSDRIEDLRTPLVLDGITNLKISTNAQNYQGGVRFFIPEAFRKPNIVPFVHLLFGVSRQSSTVELLDGDGDANNANIDWSWSLGGGAEYWFNRKWAARGKIDLLKTHYFDDSQTRARFMFGVVYNIAK